MFGSKEKTREAETSPLSSLSQQQPAASNNKSAQSKDIKTLIGEGCKIEGNFYIPTATRIDGTIKGDLTGDSGIVIGISGKVEGNVCSSDVIVYGNVTGNIDANKLELKKGCSVSGDITVNNLITEQGCMFNGRCTMKETEAHNVTELKVENA